jgi:predicted cupin superfamily sugar epimerase
MDKTLSVDQLNKRTKELIEELDLKPHPEGGFYKETYRSVDSLEGERSLMTSIYFLLTSEHVSHFHRIKSDEHWYFHEGSSLTVHLLNDKGHQELKLGSDLSTGESFYHLVPKNTIFGSTVDNQNGYALVSCVVAPGFDFRDFELLDSEYLLERYPNEEKIIRKLTIK